MEQIVEFASNHMLLVAALVVILSLLAANIWAGIVSAGKELSPAEAVHLINHDGAVVIDVREAAEYRRGHIIDAVHVPLSGLEGKASELVQRYAERPVLVCCSTGASAGRAASILNKAGLTRLHRLRGGITAWQGQSLPLEREQD